MVHYSRGIYIVLPTLFMVNLGLFLLDIQCQCPSSKVLRPPPTPEIANVLVRWCQDVAVGEVKWSCVCTGGGGGGRLFIIPGAENCIKLLLSPHPPPTVKCISHPKREGLIQGCRRQGREREIVERRKNKQERVMKDVCFSLWVQ